MVELNTSILINSGIENVWNVFIAFSDYARWNPFILSVSGNISIGKKIRVILKPPGSGSFIIKPFITKIDNGRELRWKGNVLMPGLFEGEHIFELRDNGDGTTEFIQRELFSGLLVPLFNKMLNRNTREGFELMNISLKNECENN